MILTFPNRRLHIALERAKALREEAQRDLRLATDIDHLDRRIEADRAVFEAVGR